MIDPTTESETLAYSDESGTDFVSSPHLASASVQGNYKAVILGRVIKELFCGIPLSKISLPHKKNPFSQHIYLKNTRILTRSGDKVGAWMAHSTKKSVSKWMLVLHGNSTNRYTFSYLYEIEKLIDQGVGVLIVDYRGFADSEGTPSKKAFLEDVMAAVMYLCKKGITSFGVLGYSLGTAIALEYLARRYSKEKKKNGFEITKLILVSPFISTVALLQEYKLWNAVAALIPESKKYATWGLGYNSLENIKCVDMPVLVIHGTKDWLIPCSHGEVLSNACGARLIKIHNESHSTVFKHAKTWEYIADFFKE
ncbi:hypothetical protein NECID01_0896 [Nematocida sp. AWRm77]|nr:hypothetical protein NECID01_0896 [Nematocida sp. AWRm77]